MALTACRIDLARRRIEVVEAITEVHGRVVVGTTKTHQRRSVPIPRFLADELADHLAGKAPGDLVFTAPEGGVLRNTNFRPRFFDPAAGKVGLLGLRHVESARGAVSVLPPVWFPGPLAEPVVPISRQRALHGCCPQAGFVGGQGVGIWVPR